MLRSFFISALLSLVAVVFLPRFAFSEPETKPIKIGLVYALSGPAAHWGDNGRKAAELAAKEINQIVESKGSGRKVELLFEDSKTSSPGAVAAFKKLVELDKVDVVVGDVWDFLTNPLIPLSQRSKKLLLSPCVVADSIEGKSDYFFTLGLQIRLIRKALNRFFEINSGVKTAAIIVWDNPWGQAHNKVWKDVLAAHGVTLLEERAVYGFDHDYRADVAAIAKKNPDLLLMGFHQERIIRGIHELNFHPKILTTNDLLTVQLDKLLPDDDMEGAYFNDSNPDAAFVATYTKAYGKAPHFEAHNHYQAVKVAAAAVAENAVDPRQALVKVKFNGVAGPVDFTRGFAANFSENVLKQIVNGKAVIVP